MALLAVIPGLLGLYGLAAVAARRRSGRGQAWARETVADLSCARLLDEGRDGVAVALGGHTVRVAQIHGTLDGDGTLFEVPVPAPLPPGFSLRRSSLLFGDAVPRVPLAPSSGLADLVVRSTQPDWARRVVSAPEAAAAIHRVTQDRIALVVDGGVLRALLSGVAFPAQVLALAGRFLEVAVALADGSISQWVSEGARHGLQLVSQDGNGLRLGSTDEVTRLSFRRERSQDVGHQCLQVAIGGHFPESLRMLPRSPGGAGGQSLGDLVLDRGLVAVGATGDLGARLGRDGIRGPLLDFLHGTGHRRVRCGMLEIRVPGGAEPVLLRELDALHELADRLRTPWVDGR